MKYTSCFAIALAALASFGLTQVATAAEAKKGCVLAGGEATMVTEGLAKFMAEAALKNSISGMGATPAGKIAMTCTGSMVTTSCTARQRACK